MTIPKKILVAYDGSPHSKTALNWALHLCNQAGSELSVVKVFEPIIRTYTRGDYNITAEIASQYAEMQVADRLILEEVKAFCKDSCVNVHTEILKGHPAATLLDYARRNHFDLIVTGTRGHGALKEMLVGSVTSSLLSLSEVPVLVVEEPKSITDLKKILVAYDGSPHSKKALEWAIGLSRSTGAKIVAVKVFEALELTMLEEFAASELMENKLAKITESDKMLLEEVEQEGKGQGVQITTQALEGNPVEVILEFAQTHDVDMIVAGSKGHGALIALLLGSVTRGLVSLSKIPVLVVK